MACGIFLGFSLLEGGQYSVSNGDGARKRLESGGEPFKVLMTEVAAADPSRHNQVVILNRYVSPVLAGYENTSPLLIDARHLAHNYGGIRLPFEHLANWPANLSGAQNGSRDLIEQRLKQVVVGSVDKHDPGTCVTERPGDG